MVGLLAVLVATAGGTTACGTTATTAPGRSTTRVPPGPTTSTRAPVPDPTPTTTPTTTTSAPAPTVPATTVPPSAPAGDSGLAAGPGTLAVYSVQPQPAPGTCHYRWVGPDPLPDPRCTPGAVNPAVTTATLASTICARGWTSTVRPPTSVTGPEKAASAAAYGYQGPSATAEYDHLVPLELGGDPNDPANLWLEPNDRPGATTFANGKDVVENRLRALVCAGQVPLAEAQRAIAVDWVAALLHYGS